MHLYQIIQCDVENEKTLGTYETLVIAKIAWADIISRLNEINSIAMGLIEDDLEVLDTIFFI